MIGNVGDLRTYAGARGFALPEDDAPLRYALQRASDYIEHHYVARFASGYTVASPRVAEATYEAAMLETRTPNFFNRQFTPGEQKVLVAAGPVQWERVKNTGGKQLFTPTSTRIEALLGAYLGASGSRVKTVARM